MNAFLKILDTERKSDEHIVLIMDGAGWHKSKALELPEGITALLLPPYSPELNPMENLWHRGEELRYLSNRKPQQRIMTLCWRPERRRIESSRRNCSKPSAPALILSAQINHDAY